MVGSPFRPWPDAASTQTVVVGVLGSGSSMLVQVATLESESRTVAALNRWRCCLFLYHHHRSSRSVFCPTTDSCVYGVNMMDILCVYINKEVVDNNNIHTKQHDADAGELAR